MFSTIAARETPVTGEGISASTCGRPASRSRPFILRPSQMLCHFYINQGVAMLFFLQVILQVKVITENDGIHKRDEGQVFMLIEQIWSTA